MISGLLRLAGLPVEDGEVVVCADEVGVEFEGFGECVLCALGVAFS